jgi:hypothetical protein
VTFLVASVAIFLPVTTAGNTLLVLAAIPAVAAVVAYWPKVVWRSAWGSHLMSYMIALAVPLVLGCIRLAFGDSYWFQHLRTDAFGALVVALWWRLFLIVQARHEDRPGPTPKE